MSDMSTYTIISAPDGSGFHVGIAGSDGTRQTILGFTSQAEAEAWINQDKRLNETFVAPSAPPIEVGDFQHLSP